MYESIHCKQCGVGSLGPRNTSGFCSAKCRYRHGKGTPQLRTCGQCGTDISHRMVNARYCETCYQLREQRQAHARVERKPTPHTSCVGCGAEYSQPSRKRFCSMQCAGRYNRAKQTLGSVNVCTGCGEIFTSPDRRRKSCGTACRQWSNKYPGVKRVLARQCLHCDQPFLAPTARQKYCTSTCTAGASKIRRRMALRGVRQETVSKGRVANRDRWTCQLCNRKVDAELRFPHPMSWSLDHIVPISLGGEHTEANCQLAHLLCNVSKGNRTTEPTQLRLIG